MRPVHSPDMKRTALPLVFTLGALTAFAPVAIDMYLPAFPRIARDLGAPVSSVQLTLAFFLAGIASGQLLFGPLSDRLGRRLPLLCGCLAFAAAAAFCARTHSIGQLMLARFLMGFGGSAGQVVSRAVVRDLFDEAAAARMFALMMLVTGIAPILAPVLGGWLLAHGDWHAIFWVQCAFGLACAALAALDLPETLPPGRRARGHLGHAVARYLRLLPDGRFIGPALAAGFGSGILFAYISASPFVFITLHGIPPQRFALLFALNAVALFAMAQLIRRFRRRWSAGRVVAGAFAAALAAGLLLLGAARTGWGGWPLLYGGLMACLGALGIVFPLTAAAVLHPFPRKAGTASALLGTLQYAVGASAGALVDRLHDGTAVPMAGVIAGCALAGLGAALLGFRKKGGRPAASG